jgi:hypothetical protein
MNCKNVKTQWFLTILFASPLFLNQCERAAAAARKKYDCGLRYHGLRVRTECSNLIEKW